MERIWISISIRAAKKKKKGGGKRNPFSLRKRFKQLDRKIKEWEGKFNFPPIQAETSKWRAVRFLFTRSGGFIRTIQFQRECSSKRSVAWALRQITCGRNFRLSMKLLSFDILHSIFMRQFDPLCRHQPRISNEIIVFDIHAYMFK